MATTLNPPRRAARPPDPARPDSRSAPVVIAASIGAFSIALTAYIWGRWVFSDYFRPVDPGPDDMASGERLLLIAVQAGCVALTAFILWRFVVRPWRRDRRMPNDALLIGACFLAWVWDPVFNYSQNWLVYNTHLFNMGSWTPFIPGWIAPHQEGMSEPLLTGFGYIFWVFGTMVVGCAILRRIRARWPQTSLVRFLLAGLAACIAIDFVAEWSAVLAGWYALPGGWRAISILPGTRWQLPMIEVFLGGLQTMIWVSVRYFRDDHGHSWAERGVDTLKVSPRKKLALRFCALTGALAIAGAVFNIPIQWQALHSDTWVKGLPSYLTTLCPEYETDVEACGGPGRPIPRSPDILFGDGR